MEFDKSQTRHINDVTRAVLLRYSTEVPWLTHRVIKAAIIADGDILQHCLADGVACLFDAGVISAIDECVRDLSVTVPQGIAAKREVIKADLERAELSDVSKRILCQAYTQGYRGAEKVTELVSIAKLAGITL